MVATRGRLRSAPGAPALSLMPNRSVGGLGLPGARFAHCMPIKTSTLLSWRPRRALELWRADLTKSAGFLAHLNPINIG
jgi:hypothetical protein